jgi:hypothetical protein
MMSMTNMSQLFPPCSALCGKNAVGNLAVTEKVSFPVCEECRDRLDKDHRLIFERFDFDLNKKEGEEDQI